MLGLLGTKIGMTRIFSDKGEDVTITVIKCAPNTIVRVKTEGKDGYSALVIANEELKKPTKTRRFHRIKEFKVEKGNEYKAGDEININIFEEIKTVKITSTSKGKGFQGSIKRFNFSRGPETHGSHHHREPGSVGACASPGRIDKGKKMPGRMGADRKTLKKTSIEYIDIKNNILGLKGAIPGPNGGIVRIEINS